MTTIRQKKALRQLIDHASPDDRLRHSAGMGMGEPDVRAPLTLLCRLAFVLFVTAVIVAFVVDRAVAWFHGEPLI